MIRSAVATTVLILAGCLALAPAAADADAASSGKAVKLTGTVTVSSPQTEIDLTKNGAPAGSMTFSSCGQGKTAFSCKGKATVQGFGKNDKLAVSWACPKNESCAKVATGTLTGKQGKVATIQLKAQISKAVSVGHSWTVTFTPV